MGMPFCTSKWPGSSFFTVPCRMWGRGFTTDTSTFVGLCNTLSYNTFKSRLTNFKYSFSLSAQVWMVTLWILRHQKPQVYEKTYPKKHSPALTNLSFISSFNNL